MGEGIGVLAGEPGGFTETIVCMGFAVPLPDFAENRECLPVPVDRLGRLAAVGVHVAEAVERPGFAIAIAELPVQVPGPLDVFGGLPEAAQSLVDDAEAVQCPGFTGPVAGLA